MPDSVRDIQTHSLSKGAPQAAEQPAGREGEGAIDLSLWGRVVLRLGQHAAPACQVAQRSRVEVGLHAAVGEAALCRLQGSGALLEVATAPRKHYDALLSCCWPCTGRSLSVQARRG